MTAVPLGATQPLGLLMDRQNVTLEIFSLEVTLESIIYKCGIMVCLAEHFYRGVAWHNNDPFFYDTDYTKSTLQVWLWGIGQH